MIQRDYILILHDTLQDLEESCHWLQRSYDICTALGLKESYNEEEFDAFETQEQMGVIVGKARTTVGDIITLNKLLQAIRDECREDRQITRVTLIEIARKKQERSMTTAYNAYKAKQQKGKATRQKKDPNDPQAILDS